MVSDYEYLNARARGMSARLVPDEQYLALVEAAGLEGFVARLGETPIYRRHFERIRAETGRLDIQGVESALLAAYTEDVNKVQEMSAGAPRELVDLYLTRYDLHNTRTLVRGLARSRSSDEIRKGTIPLGTFTAADLDELSKSESVQNLAATLGTWGLPFGEVLRATLKAHPVADDLLAFDVALDGAYYPWASVAAAAIRGGEDLAGSLASEVDLRNIVTLLKLARQGAARGTDTTVSEAMRYVIHAGRLSEQQLRRLASVNSLKEALDIVGATPYAAALEGVDTGPEGKVTDVERAVERRLIGTFSKMFRKDPLGFATILGYLWRRYAEFTDLRLAARGLAFGLPAADTRAQMVHA